MHTKNPQAIRRARGIAAFQWMRVVIVLGLVGASAFAVSLTAERRSASQDAITSADTRDTTSNVQVLDQSAPSSTTQVASADPDVADLTVDHAMDTGSSAASAPETAPGIIPDNAQQGAAAATPADPNKAVPLHETKQANASEPQTHTAPEMTGAVNVASNPPSGDLINLNTASFEQLNTMKGAGPLGRAIIKGRPYASVEDLVKRKVMRRSVYEKIKDQVTVR
ncbi:helix-hairpin-helix domain-containing protein [Microvirga solisilvae]|uniref:helix-hairpin-helix domain-containing protein n=1 Tax=Microvirga solisilvae TaxID=2919498 RepID=UPI001FAF0454|nr:helix-hairpin-helix domain-containing protein [Microvirga solisilvae]